MDRQYWTEERQKLFEWIKANGSESFADIYKGGVFNLFEKTPGYVRFVAHAARDLMNGMAAHKLGLERQQVQYAQLVEKLKLAFDSIHLIRPSLMEAKPLLETTTTNSEVSIPVQVMEKIEILLQEHARGSDRQSKSPYRFFQAFVSGPDDMKEAAEAFAKTWLNLQEWFKGAAHENGQLPSVKRLNDLQGKFQQLESIMLAVADHYQNTIKRIDEILDQANG
jgi:hypothetical protein